jgi:hypothetical protein
MRAYQWLASRSNGSTKSQVIEKIFRKREGFVQIPVGEKQSLQAWMKTMK